MIDYLSGPVVHEAFFKKYASKKFLKGQCRFIACSSHPLTSSSIYRSPEVGQGLRRRLWQCSSGGDLQATEQALRLLFHD